MFFAIAVFCLLLLLLLEVWSLRVSMYGLRSQLRTQENQLDQIEEDINSMPLMRDARDHLGE